MNHPANIGFWRRHWKTALSLVFYVFVGIAVWRYALSLDWAALRAAELGGYWLIGGGMLALAVKLLYPLVWRAILGGMGVSGGALADLYRVYAASWIGRYTPGKAAMIGARALYAEHVGARRAQALISFVVEQAVQVGVGTGVGLLLIGLASRGAIADWIMIVLGLAVGGIAIGLAPPVLHRAIGVFYKVVRREPMEVFPSGPSVMRAATLHLLIQLGAAGYTLLIARSALPGGLFTVDFAMQLYAAFALALVGGMFAFFAPAGLGAREAIQLALLSPIISAEQAAILVVVHRAVELVTDLLFFALAQLFSYTRPGPTGASAPGP